MADTPRITVCIVQGPIAGDQGLIGHHGRKTDSGISIDGCCGARLIFEGIVRRDEDGRALAALDYEAYEPMAQNMLLRIAFEVSQQFGVQSLHVTHSRGRVPVGECSLRVVIDTAHRGEGLEAMREFIQRLKQDVPIWKSPVWADR